MIDCGVDGVVDPGGARQGHGEVWSSRTYHCDMVDCGVDGVVDLGEPGKDMAKFDHLIPTIVTW